MAGKDSIVKVVVLGDAEKFKKEMSDVVRAAEDAGDDIKKELDFDAVGDSADGAEQKFIGFKDSITGVQDLVSGFQSGDVLTIASGFADLSGAVGALAPMIGTLATKMGIASAAQSVWTGIQAAFNAVMALNPIVLVVLAIIALVAIFVIAWQHSETFRDIVKGVFDAVWGAIQAVWDWLSENFPKLLDILKWPFEKAWEGISTALGWIKDGIVAASEWVTEKFTAIVDFVTGLPEKIKTAASGMWDGIKDAFKSALNWLIDKWNGLKFKIPSIDIPLLGKVGGFTVGMPQIARFAEGGLVRGGRGGVLGMIGEAQHDELIVPLDKAGGAAGLGTTINLNLRVPATANPVEVGREVQRVLNRYGRTAR